VKIGHARWGRFLRYAATSAVATGASATTFAVAYRLLHLGPLAASVAAFVSGAVVNFVGNRFWTWSLRQRQGLGRDGISYAVLAVTTALGAAGVTTLADRYSAQLADNERVIVVEAAYFATYAAMFLVKFVLLDRVIFVDRLVHARREVDHA
jgi:putative flippase GtrA